MESSRVRVEWRVECTQSGEWSRVSPPLVQALVSFTNIRLGSKWLIVTHAAVLINSI